MAHVVAEARDLEALRVVAAAARRAPRRRPARRPPGPASAPTPSCGRCRSRVSMCANSRSPCAAWLRFMKSMSISPHGRSRLNCVCRWRRGLRSAWRPAIHILAGLKVCIHAITPTQSSAADAATQAALILRLVSDRLEDDAHRDRRGVVQAGRDQRGVVGDLPQGVLAVQVLAPGEEPDLADRETAWSLSCLLFHESACSRPERRSRACSKSDGALSRADTPSGGSMPKESPARRVTPRKSTSPSIPTSPGAADRRQSCRCPGTAVRGCSPALPHRSCAGRSPPGPSQDWGHS